MVKNRALKRDARVIKASSGITYPRARGLITDPVDQDTLVPSLFLGYGADGGNIVHRPGKGTVLVIGGYSGSGKSVLMHRLAVEAADVASVYIIDVAKGGADYLDIRGELSALETTAAGALSRIRSLTETRHTASLLFVDYIDYTTSPDGVPGFQEALQALSDSGMPVIVGGQMPYRALPAAMMERADRMITGGMTYAHRQKMLRNPETPVLGGRYKGIFETASGIAEVILPPGGQIPEPAYAFPIGTDEAGAPATFTPSRNRNLLVSGRPGAGKTWLLRALAADAAQSMDVYIGTAGIHPKDVVWPSSAAETAMSLVATADMLDELMLKAEIRARRHSRDDAAEYAPRPVLIVLDEFASLISSDSYSTMAECTPEDREERTRIAVAVGKIARAGRAAGVTLVLASQTAEVLQLVPGSGDLKVNLSRLVLGGLQTPTQALTELRAPELQALRPATRQGVYEPATGKGGLVNIFLS